MSRAGKLLVIFVLGIAANAGCGLFGHCPEDYDCYYSPNEPTPKRAAPPAPTSISNPAEN